MIKQIKEYFVVGRNTPEKEDIAEAIDIAKNNHCIVRIRWTIVYSGYSGSYKRYIYEDDDVDDVYENRIPHVYSI